MGLVVAAVAAHLTGMHSAIKMLNSRIRVLYHHLVSIQKGTLQGSSSSYSVMIVFPFVVNVIGGCSLRVVVMSSIVPRFMRCF